MSGGENARRRVERSYDALQVFHLTRRHEIDLVEDDHVRKLHL